MGLSRKIFIVWLCVVALAAAMASVLPHSEIDLGYSVLMSFMLLLGILSFTIFRREPNQSNKAVFLNFAIFFFIGSSNFLLFFAGPGNSFLTGETNAAFYVNQYYSFVVFVFFMAFAIVYLAIDSLFRESRIALKYVAAFGIVAGFLVYYYHPVLVDKQYVWNTPDYKDFVSLYDVNESLKESGVQSPTVRDLAQGVELPAWQEGRIVGTLSTGAELERIAEIFPYLSDGSHIVLLYRPLMWDMIKMQTLIIVFLLLFFGYQYKKDPPQGAYIEKIAFLFLPYASLEILHNYSFIRSVDAQMFAEFQSVGFYLTSLVMLCLCLFFGLRLSFLVSVKGDFYERELVSDPEHISRWRDSIDNLVVRHFLNPQTIHGRLFTPREARSRT
jgi:hypothetical protein